MGHGDHARRQVRSAERNCPCTQHKRPRSRCHLSSGVSHQAALRGCLLTRRRGDRGSVHSRPVCVSARQRALGSVIGSHATCAHDQAQYSNCVRCRWQLCQRHHLCLQCMRWDADAFLRPSSPVQSLVQFMPAAAAAPPHAYAYAYACTYASTAPPQADAYASTAPPHANAYASTAPPHFFV